MQLSMHGTRVAISSSQTKESSRQKREERRQRKDFSSFISCFLRPAPAPSSPRGLRRLHAGCFVRGVSFMVSVLGSGGNSGG